MSWYRAADWGWWTRRKLADLGHAARLRVRLVGRVGVSLRRWRLVVDQVHFLGNHSLAIIAVSGLFVGFVLGLQGYYTLQRYGSSSALGLLVALSLVRELGPVVSALLFAGRAGTSLTAEIGLMKAGEQLSAMDLMAVDPIQRILAPRKPTACNFISTTSRINSSPKSVCSRRGKATLSNTLRSVNKAPN